MWTWSETWKLHESYKTLLSSACTHSSSPPKAVSEYPFIPHEGGHSTRYIFQSHLDHDIHLIWSEYISDEKKPHAYTPTLQCYMEYCIPLKMPVSRETPRHVVACLDSEKKGLRAIRFPCYIYEKTFIEAANVNAIPSKLFNRKSSFARPKRPIYKAMSYGDFWSKSILGIGPMNRRKKNMKISYKRMNSRWACKKMHQLAFQNTQWLISPLIGNTITLLNHLTSHPLHILCKDINI